MILLGALHEKGNIIEYKVYGTNDLKFMKNVSVQGDEIYKFKNPYKGHENEKFMIKFFGNITKYYDSLNYEIAHYIILKEKENSSYLISVDLFEELFQKI